MDAQVLSRGEDGSLGMADGVAVHADASLNHNMFCRVAHKISMNSEDSPVAPIRWLVVDVLQPCKIYVKDGAVIVSDKDLYP